MRETRNNTLKVVIEDVNNHPHCPHGPTILFDRDGDKFFACSYCRDKTECNFYMRATDWPSDNRRILQIVKKNKRPDSITASISHSTSDISFCDSCLKLVNTPDEEHHRDHKLLPLSQHAIDFPTSFLPPLSNDKCEAQYFFALPTLRTFEQIFRKANINKVVCIGAPRLHEFLKNQCGIKSVLLDIDQRFRWFNDEKTYFHYNMFNDHFFDGEASRNAFEEFLKEDA
jgi:Probable N6-adenine methyltransferase